MLSVARQALARARTWLPAQPVSVRGCSTSADATIVPRVRRSVLFVPAKAKTLRKAGQGLGSDVLLLDLEDAVAVSEKDTARKELRDALQDTSHSWGGAEIVVRVNALDTPYVCVAQSDYRNSDGRLFTRADGADMTLQH